MNIVIKLSKAEVEAIIKDHVTKQGFTANGVEFKVCMRDSGDYRDSPTVIEFTGVEVEANKP